MRLFKTLLVGIVVSIFMIAQVGPVFSAPNGNANNNANNNNGNNSNNSNSNRNNAQAVRGNQGNNRAVSQTRGQSAVHRQQARRSHEANQRREARNQNAQHNPTLDNNRDNRANNGRRNGEDMRNERAHSGIDLLDALNRARWSYNPHDTRGQGNMGRVDMQDPFGHDRDSDRMELYGNNGRPIRVSEDDTPQELPPEIPEDAEIIPIGDMITFNWETINEDALMYQSWADYYYSVVETGGLSDYMVYVYTYYADYYASMAVEVEAQSYQEIYLRGDATIDYSFNLDLPADQEDTTYTVTTSLVVSESFTTYTREWNYETGEWDYTPIYYEAGQVIDTVDEQVVLSGDSSTYDFSYDPAGDLLIGNEWNYDGGLFDVVINVTDTSTESTVTQTFDQSLYLYRDPYGKVADSVTGEAVIGAKIIVFTENGSIVALDKASNPTASNPQMTDATGRFAFNLRTDRKYYMVASAPGYEDYQSDVFTEQWHVIREDIKMIPKLEHMASNIE